MAIQSLSDEKLEILCDQYGSSVEELLEEWGVDSVAPGVCMNPGCDYSTEYEPDQRRGWCEVCGTQSVRSFLVLLGVV